MKFDFCVGNPPYQDQTLGDNNTYQPPVYHLFMDESYKIAKKVELIHPARFLFNAGSTPKDWNRKMLNNRNFKIIDYQENSSFYFPTTDIKGGVAVSYYDNTQQFNPIEIFTPSNELNSLLHKVLKSKDFRSFKDIVVSSYSYHFTPKLHEDFPQVSECMSVGHENDLKSNVFEKIPFVFSDKEENDNKCVRVLGRCENERVYKYIKKEYINEVCNLNTYKVFLPGASGRGDYGETLSNPIIGCPGDGSTETFLSIGVLESDLVANVLVKYIKTKFVRSLLGVLKTTQANTPEKWLYVPLQDFTSNNPDIDWNLSVAEIDKQLYKKYGLSPEEINFIETKVKPMI